MVNEGVLWRMHARAVAKFLLRDVVDDGFDESYLTVYFTDIA